MFNYYLYNKKVKEGKIENRFFNEEHVRQQKRIDYKQSSVKNSSGRVENFMIKMLDEPIVVKEEPKRFEKILRQNDPNKKLFGAPALYFRYNSPDKMKQDRSKLLHDVTMEKSLLYSNVFASEKSLNKRNINVVHSNSTNRYLNVLKPLNLKVQHYGEDSKDITINPRAGSVLSNAGSFLLNDNINMLVKKPRPYTIRKMRNDEDTKRVRDERYAIQHADDPYMSIDMKHIEEINKKSNNARSLLSKKICEDHKIYFCSVKNLAVDQKHDYDVSKSHPVDSYQKSMTKSRVKNTRKSSVLSKLKDTRSDTDNSDYENDDNIKDLSPLSPKVIGRHDLVNKNPRQLAKFALENCNLNRPTSQYLRKGEGLSVMNLYSDL